MHTLLDIAPPAPRPRNPTSQRRHIRRPNLIVMHNDPSVDAPSILTGAIVHATSAAVAVATIRAIAAVAEKLRDVLDAECAEGWGRSADDGEVEFDDCPGVYNRRFAGAAGGEKVFVYRFEAKDGCDAGENPQTERKNRRNPLPSVKLQLHNHRQRQNPNDHIAQNHQRSGDEVRNGLVWIAGAGVPLGPVVYRMAFEDTVEYYRCGGGECETEGCPDGPSEVPGRGEGVVEEEEGGFYGQRGEGVEDVEGDVEYLLEGDFIPAVVPELRSRVYIDGVVQSAGAIDESHEITEHHDPIVSPNTPRNSLPAPKPQRNNNRRKHRKHRKHRHQNVPRTRHPRQPIGDGIEPKDTIA